MIGGDVIIKDMKLSSGMNVKDATLYHRANAQYKQYSFFEILNLLIAVSLNVNPFIDKRIFHVGIIHALIYSIVLVILSMLSYYVFIRSWIYRRAYSYSQIWAELFGPSFSWVAITCVAVSYIMLDARYMNQIYEDFTVFVFDMWPNAPSILSSRWLVSYIFALIFLLPTLFVKKEACFSPVMIASNVFLVIAIICLIVHYFERISDNVDHDFILFSDNYNDNIISIGLISQALFVGPILAVVVKEIERPTKNRVIQLTATTTIVTGIITYVGNLVGFLINPALSSLNIFSEIGSDYIEVIIGRIANFIVATIACIFTTHFTATRISEIVLIRSSEKKVPMLIAGLTVIFFITGINFLSNQVTRILEIISGVTTMVIIYILPPVYYLVQYKFYNILWFICSLIVFIIGVPISILFIIQKYTNM